MQQCSSSLMFVHARTYSHAYMFIDDCACSYILACMMFVFVCSCVRQHMFTFTVAVGTKLSETIKTYR